MVSRSQSRPHRARVAMTDPLARLVALRRIEVLSQAGVLLLALIWLRIPLEVLPMAGVIALLAAVNLFTQWRLEHGKAVSENEIFTHLVFDTGVLAVLLYYAGGSTNPFVSLFLLPPTLAASMLPTRHAWAMAGLTLCAYTFLVFWKLPLPSPQGDLAQLDTLLARATGQGDHSAHGQGFALHVLGMWLNFVISVGVVAFFLGRMAATLRNRERQLAAAREAALRNERILALGMLAASAAHRLGTPLATMAVVLRELEVSLGNDASIKSDLLLLRDQVDRCKQTLSQLLATAGKPRDESLRATPLDAFLRLLVDDWQLIRPQVPLALRFAGAQPPPAIAAESTLQQAILNLLDNAADAHAGQQDALRVVARWDRQCCQIEIVDHGPGLSEDNADRLGQAFFTTKTPSAEQPGGLGIGLFLANATIERFGGKVELFNRDDGSRGACTRITLPLSQLGAACDARTHCYDA